jgi:peptide deformylase
MQIVKNHFAPGKQVKKYSEIEAIVEEMIPFVDGGVLKGEYDQAYAVAHCQVSEDPFSFFVVGSKYVDGGMWPAHAIINPQILEANSTIIVGKDEETGKPDRRNNIVEYMEGCFSFPFRKPKRVKRCYRIKVKYQIKGKLGRLKTVTEEIEGLKAHIYQHEFQHCCGGNIHFKKPE